MKLLSYCSKVSPVASWPERLFISTKTAEEHRASLLRKMAVRNTTQLASLMAKRRPPAD